MIKTYILTIPARNHSFVLKGKSGNLMRYNFTGGDPILNKNATLMLRSQYAQDLLEDSETYKKGFVRLIKTEDGGEKVVKEEKKEEPSNVIETITSPEQLIEFVATNLDKVYQRPEAALAYAQKRGYEFPNLNI